MSFLGGGEEVGQAFVSIHARPAANIDAEVAASVERSVGAINRNFSGTNKTLLGTAKSALNLKDGFTQLATSMFTSKNAALATAAAVALVGKFSLESAVKLETLNTSLKGIFQSGAVQAFEQINAFARRTPFSLESATGAVIKLSSAFEGLSSGDAVNILDAISSATAAIGGTADNTNRAIIAITQIGAAGKLTADNLRQITEALPNVSQTAIFQHLGREMHVSTAEARRLSREGMVPATEAIRAIVSAANDAAGAQGALARQSKTLSGEFNTMTDDVKLSAGTAFAPLLVIIKKTVEFFDLSSQSALQMIKNLANIATHLPIIGQRFVATSDAIDQASASAGGLNSTLDESLGRLDAVERGLASIAAAPGFSGALKGIAATIEAASARADDVIATQKKAAEAGTAAIQNLFKSTDALTSATEGLNAASQNVLDIQGQIAALRVAGPAKEIAEATRQRDEATQSLTEALHHQAEAQQALNELNAPATERELADTADAVTLAQIDVAKAIRARDAAERLLHHTTRTTLNLQGLSLDQLRSTLANARASLQAQRQVAETGKSEVELKEDALSAEVALRQSREKLTDALTAQTAAVQKGTVATDESRDAEFALERAKVAVANATAGQSEKQAELNDLLAGNTEFQRTLNRLNDDLVTAKGKVKAAQIDVNTATAAQKDDVDKILGVEQLISNELRLQIGLHQELFKVVGDRNTLSGRVTATNQRTLVESILGTFGASGPANHPNIINLFSDEAIRQIFQAIASDPAQLIALLKKLGVTIPGHAMGGLVKAPELAWLGEKFKHELVVPLQDPARAWSLLSEHLPKYLPQFAPTAAPLERPHFNITRPSATTGSGPGSGLTEEQLTRAVKTAVLEALKEAGSLGADVDITVNPTPGMSEDALVRKVKREMTRYFGG